MAWIEKEIKTKPGYKKTEVGVIPMDWEIYLLDNCCTKITDGTHDTPKPVDSGVPYLTAVHIKESYIAFDDCYFLPKEVHREIYNRCNPEKGDVLMVNIGAGVGTSALVEIDFEFSLKNVALLKPKTTQVTGEFLNYILIFFKPNITTNLLSGGAQPFFSLRQIGNIKIPLPSLPEQRAIAAALSDVDALIRHIGELIEKKRAVKQGAMQELLTGRRRLPGFENSKWIERELGSLGEFKNGINKSKNNFGFGFPFVNLMDVFGIPSIGSKTNFGLVNSNSTEQVVYDLKRGDVLFVRSSVKPSGVGLSTLITQDLKETVYSGFLIRFRDYGNLDFLFKQFCFHSKYFRDQVIANSTVSANTNINQVALKVLLLKHPKDLNEQHAIAQVLSDMDSEIQALEQKQSKYRSLKQGMMQELLTGKTRLV